MKMKKIINLTWMLLVGLVFQACGDSDKDNNASRLTITKDNVEINEVTFSIASGNAVIGINTDGEWTAESSDESWCRLAVHAGYGYSDEERNSYTRIEVDKNEGDARTANITIKAGGLSKVIAVNQKGMGTDPGDTFISGFAFVENLKLGYNLGNTLDACPWDPTFTWWDPATKTIADWETSWGQPLTTQEIIDAIAAKGFNVIRVPVTWYPHMDADGVVSDEWMNRVQEVVDMVLKAGCYCIINTQHDTGACDEGRTDGAAWIAANMDEYPTISPRFKKLWTQIANHFKGYDDKLAFEAVNEVLDGQRKWGTTPTASDMEALNKLEQDFVDAVRATGGNNEYRNLIVNPMGATNAQLQLDGMSVPTDIHANHIIATVHTYDPYNFCNDNGEWNVQVFDSSCEAEIDAIFTRVHKRFAEDFGVPYFYGEFGAIDENKATAERIKYAQYMVKKFKQYGTTGLWWMGLINRSTLVWYDNEVTEALMEGIK
ncbi:MAG: cellulase family glycosylhydrolase [Prevotella sp.]|nr:cellulase family glycosylhydrolase [Prevotella sp.]MBQ6209380.1 cellulase family glycosylhydrolase [Prevotella sp.]